MDFSPDSKLLALLDSDGKLKIWDVKESRLTRDDFRNPHVPYTCFTWLTVCTKHERKNENDADNTTFYIALGTSKGSVDLYSYASGEVKIKLGRKDAVAITCVCLHKDSRLLYTSDRNCQLVEWCLSKYHELRHWRIGIAIPTFIVCLPLSNSLLVGCKDLLSLWSLQRNLNLECTFTGHSTDVNSMRILTDQYEEYAVTTAKSNREIYLWTIDGSNGPKATFLMNDEATFVSCSIADKRLMIAATVTDNNTASGGVVHLFIVNDIGHISTKRMNPTVTIAVDSGSMSRVLPVPIVAATFNSIANTQSILIGYGGPTLLFEDVKFNPNQTKQTLKREDPRIQLRRREKTKEIFKVCGDNEKAKRMLASLMQALDTVNADLLKTILFNDDDKVIHLTVRKLPTKYIPRLVDGLAELAQKKTSNFLVAFRWLKLLLKIHDSYITTKHKQFAIFRSLLGIIEHRTQQLQQLTSVVGRLGLLLHQKNYTTDDDDERFCIIDGYGDGDVNSTDDEDERFYIIDGDGDVNSTYNDDIEMI